MRSEDESSALGRADWQVSGPGICLPTRALYPHDLYFGADAELFYAHPYPQLVLNFMAGLTAYGVWVLWFVLSRDVLGVQIQDQHLPLLRTTSGGTVSVIRPHLNI